MRSLFKYLGWSCGLILVLYIGSLIQLELMEHKEQTFNPLPELMFIFVFPVLVGGLIRFSLTLLGKDQGKEWTVNWKKLIGVGLPLLYVAMGPVLFYMTNIPTIVSLLPNFYYSGLSLGTLCGVVCGFVIIDSLRKIEIINK
ncbi:hypothetical protein [Alkalibacillus haloalkaliphilus]|uniref:hypothetical protein n=1 Tax=Alkalibacillus haloalkaliphilus TaxID=94136 RepID=UPI00293604C9|nr:hypothetical protein [Alkalibacillus haloalkaliphilus]MDV2582730.1 hypothetical protein [Alkalibacillus haloalkaliphilus]